VADSTALVDLSHGRGLKAREAEAITRHALASVVLVAGTAKSGKTTLLASLFLLFQKGPFAGYLFSGSDTLIGYETRNYFALCASKRVKPTTPRTVFSEYLHLRVRTEDLSRPSADIVLCDLSGEDFRAAKDSSDDCKKLEVLRRADRVVFLVDGGKVADPASRQRAKNDPMTLLRNCLDSGMLDQGTAVDVLFTKWDLVEASEAKDDAFAFANHVTEEFERLFAERVRVLRIARVAAHPFEADLPLGYGLEDLFPAWAEGAEEQRRVRRFPLREPQGLPEYDRYLRRRLPQLFVGDSS
jgi:hypothetical protein